MLRRIPDTVDAVQAAARGLRVHTHVALARMARLAAAVEGGAEQAEVRLALAEEQGVQVLAGEARVAVTLRCQRCLEPLALSLEAPFRLAVVPREGAPVPAGCEPVVADPRRLPLLALLEDELLLRLPHIPRHAEGRCRPPENPAAEAGEGAASQSPFAALARLKLGG
ncbi:MAG: hypothetical protein D6809_01660 [Gammaproteobacteria bacterium]|nr:MAG: hypothetical protein D6809_01660 [Gammaproteobacteria bacterium]